MIYGFRMALKPRYGLRLLFSSFLGWDKRLITSLSRSPTLSTSTSHEMISTVKLLAVVSIAALAVNAASLPTSTGGLSGCIKSCLQGAISSTGACSSYTDITCVCASKAFQSNAHLCLTKNCSKADQNTALSLQQQQCQ